VPETNHKAIGALCKMENETAELVPL
jgi:hypothetical protein